MSLTARFCFSLFLGAGSGIPVAVGAFGWERYKLGEFLFDSTGGAWANNQY